MSFTMGTCVQCNGTFVQKHKAHKRCAACREERNTKEKAKAFNTFTLNREMLEVLKTTRNYVDICFNEWEEHATLGPDDHITIAIREVIAKAEGREASA